MNLVKLNHPRRMSNIFDNFFENEFQNDYRNDSCYGKPAANIMESKDEFEVSIAAPGLNKKDFKINLENNILAVSVESKEEIVDENKKYTRKEFLRNSFKRSFTIPRTVEVEKINAEYKDGILNVVLPKKAEAKIDLNKEIIVK